MEVPPSPGAGEGARGEGPGEGLLLVLLLPVLLVLGDELLLDQPGDFLVVGELHVEARAALRGPARAYSARFKLEPWQSQA